MILLSAGALHSLLEGLYSRMLPLSSSMGGYARAIAALGALMYVAARIWRSMARAESVDVLPLLRPIAIGIAIALFPSLVLGGISGILSPVVRGTENMLGSSQERITELRDRKETLQTQMLMSDPSTAYLVSNEEFDDRISDLGLSPKDLGTMASMYLERERYRLRQAAGELLQEFIGMLYEAAGVAVDFLRTFFLVVLAVMGPLSFAISIWDGFRNTLTSWIERYVEVYLWLPVCNILSAMMAQVEVLILESDISLLEGGQRQSGTISVYCIFYLMGIAGYLMVPIISKWIMTSTGVETYANAAIGRTRSVITQSIRTLTRSVGTVIGHRAAPARERRK